ncbi:polysaccharide biosynthesis protein [Halobacteriovorax sp. ZH1_bin.1]|uniref:polysaccharide biosynthesis protein n=1 Tax=Halobacteriovorax sp. ZH1_bin.1 TaxID=3157723 RepID=UPI00371D101F
MSKLNFLRLYFIRYIYYFYDFICAIASFPIAFYIRTDLEVFPLSTQEILTIILITSVIKILYFKVFNFDKMIWRYASVHEVSNIVKASVMSVLSYSMIMFLVNISIPRSVPLIDVIVLIFLLSIGRLASRILKDVSTNDRGVRTLIVGAGQSAEQLIREIKNRDIDYYICGMLDDDKFKINKVIHGITVLDKIENITEYAELLNIEKVIIAIPTASSTLMRSVRNSLKDHKDIEVITLPSISDIADGKVHIEQLRPVNVDDLLGRSPVKLDLQSIGSFINDKTVLITGAGGSIGSDLVKQVANRNPRRIILVDACEYFIYEIDMFLTENMPNVLFEPLIADVRDRNRIFRIFEQFKPDIVFHAAAYKHVPLMEVNPQEAIKTNVFGTRNVAEAAGEFSVEKFVLISTDKAVRPANVMGASKRMAEIEITKISEKYPNTKYGAVRFGNVLASNGSVIPRFIKQIKNGGPVTVTHKDITRFFMSIPEATQLIIQAGSMLKGGEVFVLDMGNPIRIYDLAVDLIELQGLKPNVDIEIKITGLRPAEKLYEELIFTEEETLETSHPRVRVVKCKKVQYKDIDYLKDIDSENININKFKRNIESIIEEETLL